MAATGAGGAFAELESGPLEHAAIDARPTAAIAATRWEPFRMGRQNSAWLGGAAM